MKNSSASTTDNLTLCVTAVCAKMTAVRENKTVAAIDHVKMNDASIVSVKLNAKKLAG